MANETQGLNLPNTDKFNDTLASEVSWTPLTDGGFSMKTHQIFEGNYNRIEFRITKSLLALCFALFIIGGGLFYALQFSTAFYSFHFSDYTNYFLKTASFLVFFGSIGCYFYYNTPKVFDKNLGIYFWGKEPTDIPAENNENSIFLKDIHAIQIIKFVQLDDDWKKSKVIDTFELNLIMKNLQRINVLAHSDLKEIKGSAKKISELLRIPIWDVSEEELTKDNG
jgi:hypothetical protein